jgi:putative endonuclease
MANHLGKLGEDIAARYLESKGHTVVERNYWKKWGEIDIVTKGEGGSTHFCEVKSVSCESIDDPSSATSKPEENVHQSKRDRLGRVIQSYIAEKGVDEWTFDVVSVYIDTRRKVVRVVHLSDIVL